MERNILIMQALLKVSRLMMFASPGTRIAKVFPLTEKFSGPCSEGKRNVELLQSTACLG